MSSIQERAADELKRANFEEVDGAVLLSILQLFFSQWDSGGSVSVMIPVLTRLLEGKPLSPLTGDWDEWVDMSELNGGEPIWQNLRCSSVFKKPVPGGDGATKAYDLDAPRLRESWVEDWPVIQFPYMPGEIVEPEPFPWANPSPISPDPIMGALDALRCYIAELRDQNLQLAAQVVAEGEHTEAADAKIEEMLKAARAAKEL